MNVLDIGNIIDWSRESHISKYMKMEEGECFIDVGAHIGLWTLYMGRNEYKVYAFEPNPEIYKILVENTVKIPNIQTVNVALGDKEEIKDMFLHKRSVLNGLRVKTNEYADNTIEVKVYRLDTFSFTEPVGLIKIDTEGYEANILRGAREIILEDRPRLIIEVHHGLRTLREELKILTDLLTEYGYVGIAEYKRDSGQVILIADSA